jgi:hypothetical protein
MEEQVKIAGFDIQFSVCAMKDGRFYIVVKKEPYFMDYMWKSSTERVLFSR